MNQHKLKTFLSILNFSNNSLNLYEVKKNIFYRFVKRRSKEILAVVAKGTVKKRVQNHSIRLLQRELTLIRTLSVAVACFAVCWLPYGLTIMIEPDGDKHLKKVRLSHRIKFCANYTVIK